MDTLVELCDYIETDPGLSSLRDRVAPSLSADPGHDMGHVLRVGLWTHRLGGGQTSPREAVAAALCHDIVNVPKNSPERAQASSLSARAARRLLPEHGFDAASIDLIADAIRDHSFSRGAVPSTTLGRALQDADRLDALGAIGIIRTFGTGARLGIKYFDINDPWATDRRLDDIAFSLDHFFTKLLTLSTTMCTPSGRAEADRRVGIMESFLSALGNEIAAPRRRDTDASFRSATSSTT
ncbi:MAG TPA: HD domain-containing protein [Pyrinomonadaceae bacterium]|nr:HD domain-containing protein [Pyrinomonadaceae bacterium]